ncbi:hypothetical protein EN45_083310 [Penicillium chrysogenum]|jgi:hypothetical protein|uniref:Pc21g21670 protein n=2 Tax=Penicillium chrysogenum species complex TaxID=254878 RepID=B6HM75_PENRW|nr:hypothetical protein EN45_082930 [Penicillium chrysogenum]KZN89703.1 hypothetical protein EN45_083310 [Penicillium chrysogenum]CAP97064.1 Pc21g21670 [Penicillium rubens Wisconsin 54-1255]
MLGILQALFCFRQRYIELPKADSVQCDEKRPACSNCSSHRIECGYHDTSESAGSQTPGSATERHRGRHRNYCHSAGGVKHSFKLSKIQPPQYTQSTGIKSSLSSDLTSTISLADLQLLHHYTIDTYQTMTSSPDLQTMWQKTLVQWGIEFPYILHLILALSALHLAHEQPYLQEKYIQQADVHFSFGVRSVTSVFSELNADNCQRVYMSAVMICFIYFGRGPRPGQYLIFSDSGPAEWVVLMRGVRLIVISHRAKVFSGVLELRPNDQSRDLTAAMRDELHEHTIHTEAVKQLIERDITDNEARGRHLAVIENLLEIMREVYERRSAGSSGVDLMDLVMGWFYRLSEERIGSLEQKEPHILVILAHWAVLLKYMDSAWFMDGWAEHMLSGISTYLHEDFRQWIEWPLKKVFETQVE